MRTLNITLTLSLLLIVGRFITPPIGQIDGSVLTAVGMMVLFATVEKIPEAIRAELARAMPWRKNVCRRRTYSSPWGKRRRRKPLLPHIFIILASIEEKCLKNIDFFSR